MSIKDTAAVVAALQQVDTLLTATLTEERLAGFSAAVVQGDEIIWAKGFGYADLSQRRPTSPQTVYRIGSITKAFTVTMLMQARDMGAVQLDDLVAKYLPGFSFKSSFRDAPPTTLRQLATHTSGLPSDAPLGYWESLQYPTLDELLASVREIQVRLLPMSAFRYSNLSIALLGHALANAVGQGYEQFVEAHILQPLGMPRSGFDLSKISAAEAAIPYLPATDEAPPELAPNTGDLVALAPAGQMYATVEDMAQFIALQFHDGDLPAGGAQVLAGSSLREMHLPTYLDPDWQFVPCLGFLHRRLDQYDTLESTGGLYGFSASILMIPELKLGFALFANTNFNSDAPTQAAMSLLAPAVSAAIEGSMTAPAEWQRYVGYYAYPGHKGIDVSSEGGYLVLNSRQSGNRYRLVHEVDHSFVMKGGPAAGEEVPFEVNAAGAVLQMVIGPETFERQP